MPQNLIHYLHFPGFKIIYLRKMIYISFFDPLINSGNSFEQPTFPKQKDQPEIRLVFYHLLLRFYYLTTF